MKILHLYDGHERVFPGEGSVPHVVYELARSLNDLGQKVVVLERKWAGTEARENIEGVDYIRLDLRVSSNISNQQIVYEQIKSLRGAWRLILDRTIFAIKASRYIRRNDFDIIHVHLPFAANILIWLNPELRRRMTYTAHVGEDKMRFNFGLESNGPFFLRIVSPDLVLMRRIKDSIVLNEELRLKLLDKGISKDSIHALPNGVRIADYKCENLEYRKIHGLESKVVVMFAGSITPRKGVDYLVKAALTFKNDKNVIFLLAGSPNVDLEYSKKIREFIERNDLSNVRLTGFISFQELKNLYSACDIFVLPSFGEGDSIALKEALASGKPLIGTRIGGISSQIRDNWNGFLVDVANEQQLADRIRYLVDNEAVRKEMGRNSRCFAEEEFDWSKIALRYLDIYEEILPPQD